MSDGWVLRLSEFGVAFGSQVVLVGIDLDVPERGIVSLVGSAGAGKSTLLRTLAGLNDAQPALQTWGTATYLGEPLGPRRPTLVHQRARLLTATVRENLVSALPDRARRTQPEQTERIAEVLTELGLAPALERLGESVLSLSTFDQRTLAIARAALTGAPLILIDEPTAQLEDAEARAVCELTQRLAGRGAVVTVTHDRRVPPRIGGRVAFLAGGRILESRSADSFFDRPLTEPGRTFVRTGRCSVPSPMARSEHLSPSQPPPAPLPPAARAAASRSVGPPGFHWLVPGVLGGLPRPGIVRELDEDLEGLRRLGVNRLVTLEEGTVLPRYALRAAGIGAWHFPVKDMHAPELDAAIRFCGRVQDWTDAGEVVALHCRAGHGRTGTMLAAQRVWQGHSALDALEAVRSINPRWVQTDEQAHFLTRLEQCLARRTRSALPRD